MEDKHIKARLWRRLAATWVDSFVINAIAVFMIAITAIMRIRVKYSARGTVTGIDLSKGSIKPEAKEPEDVRVLQIKDYA